jgi:hypothetical protein
MTFFWVTLAVGVIGAALGAGAVLAAQWRETDWNEDEE